MRDDTVIDMLSMIYDAIISINTFYINNMFYNNNIVTLSVLLCHKNSSNQNHSRTVVTVINSGVLFLHDSH